MEEHFIELFKKYINKTISPMEVEELKRFVSASEQNKEIFRTFLKLHKTHIQISMMKEMDKEESWRRVMNRMAKLHRKRIAMWAASIAAVLVLGIVIANKYFLTDSQQDVTMASVMKTEAQDRAIITLNNEEGVQLDSKQSTHMKVGNIYCENKNGKLVFFGQSSQPIYNKLQVLDGSTYKVALSDGTEICLASNSEIIFPVGGDKRNVKLKGEALFDVKHDESRPFTIDCGNGVKVTVLGTRFNVSAHANKPIIVTVESGKVGVVFDGKTTFLNSGEQSTFAHGMESGISQVDANLYTSWASGVYEFNDAPMSVIAHQLSLWYGVKFEFSDPRLQDRKFTGALLRNKNLGFTLGLLKEVSNLNFKINGNTIVIE